MKNNKNKRDYLNIQGDDDDQSLQHSTQDPLLIEDNIPSYRAGSIRWIALLLSCLQMSGNFLSQSFPAYMQDSLAEVIFDCPDVSDTEQYPQCKQFNNMYPWMFSLYSLTNCFLPLFGGIFVDKVGVRVSMIVFNGFILVGQFVCAFAGIFSGGWGYDHRISVFSWFYVGRLIFSLGGENFRVSNSAILNKWFDSNELAFAIGSNSSFGRLGSASGGFMYPALTNSETSLTLPIITAAFVCLFSFIFTLWLVVLDKKADRQDGQFENENEKVENKQEDEGPKENKKSKFFNDIKNFSWLTWALFIHSFLSYISGLVFIIFAKGYLQYNYQDGDSEAANFMAIPLLISAIMGPVVGLVVDRIGNRQWLIFLSSSILLAQHIMWFYFPTCPYPEEVCSKAYQIIPLVILGIYSSIYPTVIWPSIPLVIKPQLVGTGLGFLACFLNLGLTIGPLLVSFIFNNTVETRGGYYYTQVFFIAISIIGMMVSILIIFLNRKIGDPLGRKKGQLTKQEAKLSASSLGN